MKILFIVVCAFPLGEASSIRAVNLVRLFAENGNEIHVIADYAGSNVNNLPCTYKCIGEKPRTLLERKVIAAKSVAYVKKYCQENQVDAILMHAKYDRFNEICSIAKKNDIKILVENCEWYHYSNFKLKLFDLRFWKNQKMLMFDFRKANGFISISSFLNDYNSRHGQISVRIPTIMDVNTIPYRIDRRDTNKIIIVYTGNPGYSKEYLEPMIRLLADSKKYRDAFEFHIYGVNEQQLIKNINVTPEIIQKADNSLFIHGRVPQETINQVLIDADYQLFIRPYRKSSNAGFPTKMAESMAVGTPVITNDTGDIGLYLKDGINGFIVPGNSFLELENTLNTVLGIGKEQYAEIRKNARKTSEESFDYRNYVGEINTLLRY